MQTARATFLVVILVLKHSEILTLSAVNDAIAVTAAVIDVVLCTLWRQWDLTRQAAPALRALAAVVSARSYYNASFTKAKSIHVYGAVV